MALGVPGRLRPWIFSTFGTTRVVGRQPNAPAAFTPAEIPGTHFQRLSRHQGTWFCRKERRKKIPSDTTEDLFRDRPTSSAAPLSLSYPRPQLIILANTNCKLSEDCVLTPKNVRII